MYDWSNPYASAPDAAQLMGQAKVGQYNLGSIVAAILEAKARKQQADQQSINQLISGIGSAAKGVGSAYMQNQQNTQLANYLGAYRTAQQSGTPGGESEAMREMEQSMDPALRAKVEEFLLSKQQQPTEVLRGPNGEIIAYNWHGQRFPAPQRTGVSRVPVQGPGGTYDLTPHEALIQREKEQAANQANAQYDTYTKPGVVTYYLKKDDGTGFVVDTSKGMFGRGQQLTDEQGRISEQTAQENPDQAVAVLPDGTRMSYKEYVKMAGKVVSRGRGVSPLGDTSAPGQGVSGMPSSGMVHVYDPTSGRSGTIPASSLDAYLNAGWIQD